jgi:hypothetical protein
MNQQNAMRCLLEAKKFSISNNILAIKVKAKFEKDKHERTNSLFLRYNKIFI